MKNNINPKSDFEIIHKSELAWLLCLVALLFLVVAGAQTLIAVDQNREYERYAAQSESRIAEMQAEYDRVYVPQAHKRIK